MAEQIHKLKAQARRLLSGAARKSAAKMGLIEPFVPHQASAYRVLSRYVSMEGKHVLEIGGAQSAESMRPFLDAKAERAVVSGLEHVDDEVVTQENISIVRADALSLSDEFGPESFDIIYGLSIIEHIPSPDVFLRELRKVLRPDGLAYLEGNPVWSSAKGHHLWIATWGGPYQNRATANYLFNPYPGLPSSNPLPDWSHLLMSREEMAEYLERKELPKVDVDCILDWVYDSDNINRLTMETIAEQYTTSGLVVLEANTQRSQVPPDTESALRKKYGDGMDYGISGVSYVLTRR